jgi:hypothetical protein
MRCVYSTTAHRAKLVPRKAVNYGPTAFRWTCGNHVRFNDTALKRLSEAVANTCHFHRPVHSPRDHNPGVHPSLTLTSMVTPGFIFLPRKIESTSYYSPWLSLASSYGSQGPYSGRHLLPETLASLILETSLAILSCERYLSKFIYITNNKSYFYSHVLPIPMIYDSKCFLPR